MTDKLDLSNLPPEIRQKVMAGLARMPPEARQKWEAQGSPLLAKLVAGLAGDGAFNRAPPPVPTRTAAAPNSTGAPKVSPPRQDERSKPTVIHRTPPHGHYNDTIAPGDRPELVQRLMWGLVIAGILAWLFQ